MVRDRQRIRFVPPMPSFALFGPRRSLGIGICVRSSGFRDPAIEEVEPASRHLGGKDELSLRLDRFDLFGSCPVRPFQKRLQSAQKHLFVALLDRRQLLSVLKVPLDI